MHDAPRLDFAWLLRLRWAALAVEAWIVGSVEWCAHQPLPALPLGAIATMLVITNLFGHLRLRSPRAPSPLLFTGLMAADVLALTGVLWLTGGAANPYSVFYLVYIALAVITVPTAWAWALVALSVGGYASLFIGHDPHAAHDMAGHLQGMWVAFAITATAVLVFVGRVNAALAEARRHAASVDRLASLGTLAAGAAHELSSPLGTIAIAAKELRLSLGSDADPDVVEDAELISDEVRRCRHILERLAIDAGQPVGEPPQLIDPRALVATLLSTLPCAERVVVEGAGDLGVDTVYLFEHAVTEALRAVVENALLTSALTVTVHLSVHGHTFRATVHDDGPGMPPEVLTRATEPFFTTRPTGEGMGLGLFLASTLTERGGGTFQIDSALGQGTTVRLRFPIGTS